MHHCKILTGFDVLELAVEAVVLSSAIRLSLETRQLEDTPNKTNMLPVEPIRLLLHRQQLLSNAHAVTSLQDSTLGGGKTSTISSMSHNRVGVGLFPKAALFNHR
jgi:hypothetical protein